MLVAEQSSPAADARSEMEDRLSPAYFQVLEAAAADILKDIETAAAEYVELLFRLPERRVGDRDKLRQLAGYLGHGNGELAKHLLFIQRAGRVCCGGPTPYAINTLREMRAKWQDLFRDGSPLLAFTELEKSAAFQRSQLDSRQQQAVTEALRLEWLIDNVAEVHQRATTARADFDSTARRHRDEHAAETRRVHAASNAVDREPHWPAFRKDLIDAQNALVAGRTRRDTERGKIGDVKANAEHAVKRLATAEADLRLLAREFPGLFTADRCPKVRPEFRPDDELPPSASAA